MPRVFWERTSPRGSIAPIADVANAAASGKLEPVAAALTAAKSELPPPKHPDSGLVFGEAR